MSPPKLYLFLGRCLLLLLSTFGQEIYQSVSCPDVFKYSYDSKFGGHHGLVTVQKDSSSISDLQINMTTITKHYLYNKLQIVVLSRSEEFFHSNNLLQYAVLFPTQIVIPKLTWLQFNGRTLCFGVTDPLVPGFIQTHLWAKSVVTTYGPIESETFLHPFDTRILPQALTTTLPSIQLYNNPSTQVTLTNDQFVTPAHQTIVPTPADIVNADVAHQCGTVADVQSLIVKGQDISPGDFPWLAAIMYKKEADYKFHCTGNLISNQHILTAGHCVNSSSTPINNHKDLVIVLGKLSMNNWAEDGTVREAKTVIIHPNYEDNNAASDIAIVILHKPVTFKATIRPICLWNSTDSLDDIVGKSGTVAGWAPNQEKEELVSTIAQKVEMPVVSQEQCLRSNKIFKRFTSPGTFCAGKRDNSGPCMGDSGAGFAIKDDSTNRWYLRGLVGFSIRDPVSLSCDLSNFVIFTDISKIRSWIYQETQKH